MQQKLLLYMLFCAEQMRWHKSEHHCLVYLHPLWRIVTFGEVSWSSWGLAFCAAFLHRMVIYGFKQTSVAQIPLMCAPGALLTTLGSCKDIMAANDNCRLPLNATCTNVTLGFYNEKREQIILYLKA